jgi:hypothetical protein
MIRDVIVVIAFGCLVMGMTWVILFIMCETGMLKPVRWPPPIDVYLYSFVIGIAGGIKYVILKRRGSN